MTITEAVKYMEEVYLKEGWITPQQVRKIKAEAWVITLGILAIALIPAILILIIWG